MVVTSTGTNHEHQLSITNQSPNETWPAGSYKAYVRVHVPESVAALNVSIDGNPLPPEQVSNLSKGKYRVFSHPLEIKPGVTSQLKYTYTTPMNSLPKTYAFGLQKQPGSSPDAYRFTITSQNQSLVVSTTNSQVKEGTSFSGVLDKNTFAAIELH